jgi:hypothetical protein
MSLCMLLKAIKSSMSEKNPKYVPRHRHNPLSNCPRLHAFTKAFYSRLPAELRTMTYDAILNDETKAKLEKGGKYLPYAFNPCWPREPSASTDKSVLHLRSMDPRVASEIGVHFYANYKRYEVFSPQWIAEFLAHDFLGLNGRNVPNVSPGSCTLQRLVVHISINAVAKWKPGRLLAQFEPLIAVRQNWAQGFELRLVLGSFMEHPKVEDTRKVLAVVEEVIARAEDEGRKGVVTLHYNNRSLSPSVVERYAGWLADYILENPRVYLMKHMQNRRRRRLQGTT